MKLVAFDGDNTLWQPVSGLNLSDRTPTDDVGWPDFSYTKELHDPLVVRRDDDALFRLRPEAREVLEELHRRGVLAGVISYNHVGNVERVLGAFGVLSLVDYIVAEWHTDKDLMLGKMLDMAHRDGYNLSASDLLLVDDDPDELYGGQCERMGVAFLRFGVEIHDLRDVLGLLGKQPSQLREDRSR